MSETRTDLLGVYVDGETKTGKGAAGHAIAEALRNDGKVVYYDVAGDFFRRYVALVRQHIGLSETDALPAEGPELERAAQHVYQSRQPFEKNESLGDLQRPAIANSVAILSKLPLVQRAGGEWWAMTIRLAHDAGAEVVVLDGRNPRSRVRDQVVESGINPITALELFMTCDPEIAARRSLLAKRVLSPTPLQLSEETNYVIKRREDDRHRTEVPFQLPVTTLAYEPANMSARDAVEGSWRRRDSAELPITISLDNSHLTMTDMLSAVTQLALFAVNEARTPA